MRRYETTFIVNPQADDAAIEQQVSAVINLIKSDGGQILNENRIGTRRLAYPINGLVQGYYASLIYDAETTVLPKMDRFFKLEEPYIRSLTIRFEGNLPTPSDDGDEGPSDPGNNQAEAKEAPAEPKKAEAEEKPADEAPAEQAEETPADKPETDDEEL